MALTKKQEHVWKVVGSAVVLAILIILAFISKIFLVIALVLLVAIVCYYLYKTFVEKDEPKWKNYMS